MPVHSVKARTGKSAIRKVRSWVGQEARNFKFRIWKKGEKKLKYGLYLFHVSVTKRHGRKK